MAELDLLTNDDRARDRVCMLRPLRIRDFALLWAGMTVSLFGDGILLVAIPWQVYELSNAPTALSVVGIAWTVPMVAFLVVGGVVSDRFDRRRVMIVSDVIRFAAVGAIGILAVADAISLPWLLGLMAVYGVGEALFAPAFGALVPDVVPPTMLVEANSMDMFVRTLAERLAGPALGGVLIALAGTGGAFLIDAGTFVVSALCLLAMRARPLAAREAGTSALADVAEGFRFVRAHTWIWGTLLAASVSLLAYYGPWEVLVPYVVKNTLDGSAADLGLVFGVGGVGALAAAVLMGHRPLPRRHMTFVYVTWALGVGAMVAYGVATALWHAMAAAFIGGALSTAGLIVWATLLQTRVPRSLLGRVTSLDWLVSIGLIPVSYALTGPIAAAAGVSAVLVGGGIIAAVTTIAFLFLPGMRDSERVPASRAPEPA